MRKKTLTVVLCQTRESELTYNSLRKNVLKPLKSDLAFCGSSQQDDTHDDILLKKSRYVWNFDEPLDWGQACDQISTREGNWRDLARLSKAFLGGTGYQDSVGSGIIIMYWREVLRVCLTKKILDSYEWFVITRSDFYWEIEHPKIKLLDADQIYFLDGEKYGGLSDRHIIFHRKYADRILKIAEPIFKDSKELGKKLQNSQIDNLNPEQYLNYIFKEFNLLQHVTFIPYLGYTIRQAQTSTRWSKGVFNDELGLFVKYPEEYRMVKENLLEFKTPTQWKTFFDMQKRTDLNPCSE